VISDAEDLADKYKIDLSRVEEGYKVKDML
jgi:hypothetical protein